MADNEQPTNREDKRVAKEIILGGVPREDLDDDGNFLPGKEEYHRKYNQAWGGYRGMPEPEPAPAPRKRKSAPAVEQEPEVAPEQEPEQEPAQEQAPEPAQEPAQEPEAAQE